MIFHSCFNFKFDNWKSIYKIKEQKKKWKQDRKQNYLSKISCFFCYIYKKKT